MRNYLTHIFWLLAGLNCLHGQESTNRQTHIYHIHRIQEAPKVDGVLDEDVWQQAEKAAPFRYSFPVDDKVVEEEYQTEVMMAYDDKNIYIAAICHGSGPYVIPSLKRDNNRFWRGGDVFSVVFDPVNERTNGVGFATNPAGVQHETLVGANLGTRGGRRRGGGSGGFNSAWDNKWVTNARQYADRWTLEMAIPFKSLKYGNKKNWGINFLRGVSKTNSWHTWAPVPRQFMGPDLGYTGTLRWDEVPPKAKSNVSIIPYVLGSTFKDTENETMPDNDFRAGGDAKIAVTSNLNLDLTLLPDFSQVDVDEQVTNLTTVNIRFPEKRLFFLENSDLFADFGIPPMRPFFSRKIGLDDDGNPIPILYGARLSGNVNKDLRIGAMNLQTKNTAEANGQNYTATAFSQRIFGRTSLKAYFLNRQAWVDDRFSAADYNRTAGAEFDFRSLDGSLRANVGFGASFTDGVSAKNKLWQAIFSYNNRSLSFYTNVMGVGDNYIPDMGFMTQLYHYDAVAETEHRIGYTHSFTRMAYTFYPENKNINTHRLGLRVVFDATASANDLFIARLTGSYGIGFANTSSVELTLERQFTQLFFPFAFTTGEPLPADEYHWAFVGATYRSDSRRAFFFDVGFETGGFYNGDRRQFSFGLNYRLQPWGNFGVRFVRNDLKFPDPWGQTQLTLIGPKIEVNFSRNLYWTTFLQYNTQRDNFNINSRLQWQFQPLSNLFIVYTDNYAIEMWGPKNRALVVKVNYWLNL